MYTIAICDPDEEDADTLRISIHNILDELKTPHLISSYNNSAVILKILKKYPEKYRLLFLETQLKPYDGIELGKRLRQEGYSGDIVYASSTASYVFDGYDVEACQYFVKPVHEVKLRELFYKITGKALEQESSQNLLLNYGTNYYKIRYCDILYIETAGRKIAIHTKETTIYHPCKLSEIEAILPSSLFVRCHQSFILQLGAIKALAKSQAILKDGSVIPISRSYKELVHSVFVT